MNTSPTHDQGDPGADGMAPVPPATRELEPAGTTPGPAPLAFRPQDRRLPEPFRSRRTWTEAQAREQLECSLTWADPNRGHSIYVHVPFCRARCPFCDLYCFAWRPEHHRAEGERFLAALRREIRWYASIPAVRRRPVTTVHFGGGTPLALGGESLAWVVDECRRGLGLGRETEIAVESRVSDLTADTLRLLSATGVRRIHLGVQTLDDRQRAELGRVGGRQAVLELLAHLLAQGFVVSVDLLYGLPGQSPSVLAAEIDDLASVGVLGFSLYELNRTGRNHRLFDDTWRFQPDRGFNRELAAAGADKLRALGFRRRFFTHFSRGADGDLYSTHPARGEEGLAFGPTADGHCGGLHWSNHGYRKWLDAVESGGAGVATVCLLTPEERELERLECEILSCRVATARLRRFADRIGADPETFETAWVAAGLAHRVEDMLELTDSGAWWAGNVIEDLRGRLARWTGRAAPGAEMSSASRGGERS